MQTPGPKFLSLVKKNPRWEETGLSEEGNKQWREMLSPKETKKNMTDSPDE